MDRTIENLIDLIFDRLSQNLSKIGRGGGLLKNKKNGVWVIGRHSKQSVNIHF